MATRSAREILRAPLLREPTLHFALLAGALFLVTTVVGRKKSNEVEINRASVEAAVAQIEAQNGTPLGARERQEVERTLVRQEILVREALARDLDQGDSRIREILVQKMLDVLAADVIQPTEAELSEYYEANKDRYRSSGTVTVDELVIPVAGSLPPALQRQLEQDVPAEALKSDLPLSSKRLQDASLEDLAAVFDPETASRLSGAEPGHWVGPYRSVRGQHWFWVVAAAGSRLPPLDEIREQLRLDWAAEQETARLERRVAELENSYSVKLTGNDTAQ